jgi:hypothetical protein
MIVIHMNVGRLWSDIGPYTARRVRGGWVVSWLPRRVLDARQALIALRLAELYCGKLTPGSTRWRRARAYERELGIVPGRSGLVATASGVGGW